MFTKTIESLIQGKSLTSEQASLAMELIMEGSVSDVEFGSFVTAEKLGANIDLAPNDVERCIQETGFGFMFAQRYHPSMKFAAKPRKDLGLRTVFNILGPLTNPANAEFHLLGVADPSTGKKIAQVLAELGSKRALVVHGKDNLDEVTLSDNTQVWELKNNSIIEYEISPKDFGFDYINKEDIQVKDIDESIQVIMNIFNGLHSPHREIVLINSAVALLASDTGNKSAANELNLS